MPLNNMYALVRYGCDFLSKYESLCHPEVREKLRVILGEIGKELRYVETIHPEYERNEQLISIKMMEYKTHRGPLMDDLEERIEYLKND